MSGNNYGPELYVWVGLSTETKPPKAYAGQRAFETDTFKEFKWVGDQSGGSWVKYYDGGAKDVALQDQTSRPLIAKFNEVQNSTTLSVAAVKGSYEITVTATTGFVAGRYIILFDPDSENFSFYTQIGAVAGNVVTLDTPVDFAYPIGTFVDAAITNMNVDGSGTPRVFGLRGTGAPPGVDITADVTRIIFQCTTTTAVSLPLFGNLAALTNGLVLRRRDGTLQNIFNVKTNGDLAGIMFDFAVTATLNPVQGRDGFVCRLSFGGQSKIGVVIRLPIGEDLEFLVQDNLAAGPLDITLLEVVAEGHIVVE